MRFKVTSDFSNNPMNSNQKCNIISGSFQVLNRKYRFLKLTMNAWYYVCVFNSNTSTSLTNNHDYTLYIYECKEFENKQPITIYHLLRMNLLSLIYLGMQIFLNEGSLKQYSVYSKQIITIYNNIAFDKTT